jgi:aryl-alcohol dehydrogenase-like predicted oxidoreductase
MKKKLNSTLLRLLNSGMVKRVGISVYTPRELDKFISLSDLFTEIQLPLNPLNQSFRYYLDEFEEISSYRIVVRSIFQQGLLTLNSHSYPPFFKNSPEALNWNNFLKEYEIDALTACIQFIKKISWVNQVVIGINSYLQLQQIFNAFAVNNATVPLHKYDQLHSQNIEIRDPRKWPHD